MRRLCTASFPCEGSAVKNFKWDRKYLYWGVTAVCVFLVCKFCSWIFDELPSILTMLSVITTALTSVIYGLIFAYLLNKIMVPFEKHLFTPLFTRLMPDKPVRIKKLSRGFSVTLSEITAVGIVAGLIAIFIPQILESVVSLADRSETYFRIVSEWAGGLLDNSSIKQIMEKALTVLTSWLETSVIPEINTLLSNIAGSAMDFVKSVFNIIVGLIISIYLLYGKERFCGQIKKVLSALFRPSTVRSIVNGSKFIDEAFGNYIIGTLIDALIIGVVTYIFMVIAGIPYSALIAILVGITNIIPVFGPFIGIVPSAFLILLESPVKCLAFVVFSVVLQQIDGNVIKPRIHGSKAGISGFWIMFSITFFGGIFGIPGMILGVPLITILYEILRRYNNRRLESRNMPISSKFYMDIEYIDPETNEPVYKKGHEPADADDSDGT